MFDIYLRELKEKIFKNFVSSTPQCVTPNLVTLFSLIFGIISALACSQGLYTIGLYSWIINRILDGYDGTLARVRKMQTDFGGYFDIIADFITYSIVPIGIAYQKQNIQVYFALSIMLGTFFVNSVGLFYLSAILEKRKLTKNNELTTISMPQALIEGTETVVMFSLFIIFQQQIVFLYWLFSIGVSISITQRVIFAKKVLKE
ncbi:hypothetical protein IMG5_053740 [Ichthyophthirius multifiliis]|uniref:CDP-alcohol phosphatidyltransferase family protein n=1 Tax=Ichthyophthirius multifiliis TaxID=5932 RepID=G0QMY6_ICHMU|nr:hypothetical protein IMG5_053740 [Ichthyophthirius multifiliis]EGR33419.1 hypothetical protein IMG5_053740 [Ichthyophthirius multifiliis]|eukprot:XP_004037405.1 hypothetical protein IMG5_053740 [Ichthyophthirius multifiliis]